MPPKVSLISDVGALTIEGGSFTMNVQQTTIRKSLARHDLDSANAKQSDDFGRIVESRMQKFSKNLEDHQKAVFSVVRRLQPESPVSTNGLPSEQGYLQQDTAHSLLSRAQQLSELLPLAHLDLARQFAGAVRPHTLTNTRSIGDNLVLVGAPLLSSSIFSTLSAEVQFMVFYFLVAMIFVDVYHPRLIHNRPSSRVSVLDALGKYHDFPWSACENMSTFHSEFLRRFLNQTGFSFVKSKLYEVEYNNSVMKPDDWATVKPFTDLFVNFILIQQAERPRVVRCPWCRKENPLPFGEGSEESITKCSCSECGRDFSTAVGGSVEDGGDRHTLPPGLDRIISVEIRRFRIRLQSRKQSFPSPYIHSPYIPFSPYVSPGLLPEGTSPWVQTSTPFIPPLNTPPGGGWGYPPWQPPESIPWSGYPRPQDIPFGPLPQLPQQWPTPDMSQPGWGYSPPSVPPAIPPPNNSMPLDWTGYPYFASSGPLPPYPYPYPPTPWTGYPSRPLPDAQPFPYPYTPYPQPCSSSQATSTNTESESAALRNRQRRLQELLGMSPLGAGITTDANGPGWVPYKPTCLTPVDSPTDSSDKDDAVPPNPHFVQPDTSYLPGRSPNRKLAYQSVVELDPDDTQVLEPGVYEPILQVSSGLQSQSIAEDGMNVLGLWGVPVINQPSLSEGSNDL